jgi:hypothetical protein
MVGTERAASLQSPVANDLSEVIAGLGSLAEGEALGIEVIGHAPIN